MAMSYKTVELLAAGFLLAVAIVGWISIRSIPADARMFPNAILITMGLGSALMIVRSLMGTSQKVLGDELDGWSFAINPQRMLGGFLIFAVYIWLVKYIGFFTMSAIFVIVMGLYAGYRNWPRLIASAVGYCLFVYVIFTLLFERPLPKEIILTVLTGSGAK